VALEASDNNNNNNNNNNKQQQFFLLSPYGWPKRRRHRGPLKSKDARRAVPLFVSPLHWLPRQLFIELKNSEMGWVW